MKLLVFSTKDYELPYLERANTNSIKVKYTKDALDSQTAFQALGCNAISIFSGDGIWGSGTLACDRPGIITFTSKPPNGSDLK